MENCVFCKIVNGEIKSEIIYENDVAIVIKDAEPVVSTHLLIIPKEHRIDLTEYEGEYELLGKIVDTANEAAKHLNLDSFRVINNCKEAAGQSVFHTHFHILNDESLKNVFM